MGPSKSKYYVPLKVWIIASASCFAVCAALVLATVVITKWGTGETYTTREMYFEPPEPIYSIPHTRTPKTEVTAEKNTIEQINREIGDDIDVLEKLAMFKNMVTSREKKKLDLISKPQIHPMHDEIQHTERRIEKKDRPKLADLHEPIPDIKPDLPDVSQKLDIRLPNAYLTQYVPNTYFDEYYNDDNLYTDYLESNTMTSYLIEKVQELHDWVTSDADFKNNSTRNDSGSQFGVLLKALNESIVEGNVTIVMNKLRDLYFGENYTVVNRSRKAILSNTTDVLSFGILTLDVMLLHNIQLMAWENQESARVKMLKDPNVFAFNALFLDPGKIEAKQNELQEIDNSIPFKRQNFRQESEDFDFGKNLLENILDIGMSTARAAIHLGRVYKNTRTIMNQLSNRDVASIQNQISRNIDGNTHALNRLQTSFNRTDSVANMTGSFYTELDCIWLLYCRNLVATSKLNAPYGTMARINGMALRMITGELSADRALDTMLYEALAGWTELKCNDMFPRCTKVNAASVVMDSIMQPKKSSINKT